MMQPVRTGVSLLQLEKAFAQELAMITKYVFFLLVLGVTSFGYAKPLADHCKAKSVKSISRPWYPEKKSGKTFSYRFQVREGKPGKPTVILTPGGPGDVPMGSEKILSRYPKDFTVILTEPRGIGCNESESGEEYPLDFFTNENVAHDVVSIVKSLKLKNYHIHGVSWGTVIATIATKFAESEGLPPKSTILSGVIGHGVKEIDWLNSVARVYHKELTRIRPESREYLFSLSKPPLGLSQEQWAKLIEFAVTPGDITPTDATQETFLASFLNGLGKGADKEKIAAAEKLAAQFKNKKPEKHTRNWKSLKVNVSCRSIFGAEIGRLVFNKGVFSVERKEKLRDFDKECLQHDLTSPYDSKRFLVKTPLHYVQGIDDPYTPVWGAVYHHENQIYAKRQMLLVKNAGHSPLFTQLTRGGCSEMFWKAVTENNDFSSLVKKCKVPTVVWAEH